ncbi:Arm DNA-binding domain-containing protein [Burkholderia pseudomallei]|uniref:Arm DNA-binding domain-containing protein n=1 Tax=Burkholderia pseudomallei TaxID=28450 RepID=UPI0039849143
MPLTTIEINQSKAVGKPFKLPDGNGLYLYVTPTSKSWRFDYRIGGKRGTVVYGLTRIQGARATPRGQTTTRKRH